MAKKDEQKEAPKDDGLLVMEKDGEKIRVHPDQVAQWKTHGWTEAE